MDKKAQLEEVAQQVAQCRKCSLYKTATNPVSGEGNPDAELVLVGEAPGFWEDQKGIPFCGAAGKLLNQLLAEIGLGRSQVFICNMLRHRPPNNRDPLPEEIKACQPFLDQQIKIIDPKIIVSLGRFSLNKFLPGEYISRVHGQARYVEFAGKKRIVLPMYHPAAALRNGGIMVQLKQDFKRMADFLGKKIEEKEEKQEKESQLTLI